MSQDQSNDEPRPETFPVYRIAIRVRPDKACDTAVVGLKSTGLDIHFDDDHNLFFDLERRLLRVSRQNVQWRRGLSHRTLELQKRPRQQGGGFHRQSLDTADADALIDANNCRTRTVREAFRSGQFSVEKEANDGQLQLEEIGQAIERAAAFDAAKANEDMTQFRAVYGHVPILPPDQYTSLVLMATEGCRFNTCTFCGFYRDSRYREKTLDEFQTHIREAIRYHGRGLAQRRGTFPRPANAPTAPQPSRAPTPTPAHAAL